MRKKRTKMSVYALLATIFWTLSGCTGGAVQQQYEAEKLFYRANKLFQKLLINPRIASESDYEKTIHAYDSILNQFDHQTRNPSILSIIKTSYLNVARLWTLRGEFAKASQTYEAFLKNYPDDGDLSLFAHFANASSNERIFNVNKTFSEYETIIKKFGNIQDPMDPNVKVLTLPLALARLKTKAGETSRKTRQDLYRSAENYYLSLMRKTPDTTVAFYAAVFLASIYADEGRWYNVIDLLENTIQAYPNREEIPNLRLTLGNVYLSGLGNTKKALQIFDALTTEQQREELRGLAYFSKAKVLAQERRFESARKLLKWIMTNFSSNDDLCASAQFALASTYETQGRWDRALIEYKWVQEKYPLTPEGLLVPLHIADYYRKQGEKTLEESALLDAIGHFQTLVRKYPKTMLAGIAQEYIIYCLSAQKAWDSAARAATALRQIYPGTRSEISSYLFLGQIYESMRHFEEAKEVYNQFLQRFPNHPLTSKVRNRMKQLSKG